MLRIKTFFLLLFAFALTLLVYLPGLNGPFIFDDFPNVVQNNAIAIPSLTLDQLWRAAFSSDSGPLSRPISMASFAVNYHFTGLSPFGFKATNLAIHLVNGFGIFILSALLLGHVRRRIQIGLTPQQTIWISIAVATAWLLHPFNLTSVLYAVQRMTSLAALFCIYGLALFVWGRARLLEGFRGGLPAIWASLLVFTPLAALSKETGALLPLFMLVIEFTLFEFRTHEPGGKRWLIAFFLLSVALPALAAGVFMLVHPQWLMGAYATRDFSLAERVMTEGRILWFYLKQIVLPNIAAMGFYHDDFTISTALTKPMTTLYSLLGIVALLIGAIAVRKRAPILALGILFYLAGHALESTIFPLELVYEHRNYLPMFGIEIIVFYYLLHPSSPDTLRLRYGLAVLLIGLFAFDTHTRATDWSNPFDFNQREVQHHPDSPRANDELAFMYANIKTPDKIAFQNNALMASFYFLRATELDDHYVNGLFGLIALGSAGRITPDAHWAAELANRLAHGPFANDTADHLISLVTCLTNGECKLEPDLFQSLVKAALSNPNCTGTNRASVFNAQSYYLINIAKDYPAGLQAMENMVASAPGTLENRMTLIKYLIALQRFPEAGSQLDILRRMDTKNLYAQQIALYRAQIPPNH